MEFLTKSQKIETMNVGSKVWAGLDTFYQGPDLSLTEYPLSSEQLALNLVEGKCVKKMKRSFEIEFPSKICKKKVVLNHKDLLDNQNTFVDEGDLPKKSIIVKSGDDMDYLVGLAPPLKENGEDDFKEIVQLREEQYKLRLDSLWAANLAFKLNEVEFVPVAILARNLPHLFGTPVSS